MFKYLASSLVVLAVACSGQGTNVVVNQQTANAATGMEKTTANMVKGLAKTTPPANGTSMGMMSQPSAGKTTIPINNVEVYVFTADIDTTHEGEETLYWAYDGHTVYLWGQIGLDCVDDAGMSTGETGTADFVYTESGSTYGWMLATDACGYSTFFGCSNNGGGEVCGGCDFNDAFIACVAASS